MHPNGAHFLRAVYYQLRAGQGRVTGRAAPGSRACVASRDFFQVLQLARGRQVRGPLFLGFALGRKPAPGLEQRVVLDVGLVEAVLGHELLHGILFNLAVVGGQVDEAVQIGPHHLVGEVVELVHRLARQLLQAVLAGVGAQVQREQALVLLQHVVAPGVVNGATQQLEQQDAVGSLTDRKYCSPRW
jgi:hypothetical protein